MVSLTRWTTTAVILLALTGCTSELTVYPPEPVAPSVPAWFTDRPSLRSCGEIELGQGEQIPDDAIQCMRTATEGAELVVTSPTTEGDPVTTYYRVGPDIDGMDLIVDAREDAWGSGEWEQSTCPGTKVLVDPRGGCAVD